MAEFRFPVWLFDRRRSHLPNSSRNVVACGIAIQCWGDRMSSHSERLGRAALLSILLSLGLQAGPAAAQPTAAQQQALRSNCRSDYMANCSSVTPGGARGAAMPAAQRRKALAGLSERGECRHAAAERATTDHAGRRASSAAPGRRPAGSGSGDNPCPRAQSRSAARGCAGPGPTRNACRIACNQPTSEAAAAGGPRLHRQRPRCRRVRRLRCRRSVRGRAFRSCAPAGSIRMRSAAWSGRAAAGSSSAWSRTNPRCRRAASRRWRTRAGKAQVAPAM